MTAPASRRPLWMVVGLLLVAAGLLWTGSLRGGGAGLSALAVLALAVVAAALAAGGWLRRALGVLTVAAALGAVPVALDRPAVAAVLGVLAAVPFAAAGGLLVLRGHRMPRMGSRYQARPTGSVRSGTQAMWDELDAGRDPTA